MYIRFTTPGAVTRAGIRPGFFAEAYDAWRAHRDEPLGIALRHELDWFGDHLPVPSGRRPFAVRAKGRWFQDGVCWFRDDAREHLMHAHVMAALIEDCGIPVDRQLTEVPGQILYRDTWQVVAKPDWHWCPPAPLEARWPRAGRAFAASRHPSVYPQRQRKNRMPIRNTLPEKEQTRNKPLSYKHTICFTLHDGRLTHPARRR